MTNMICNPLNLDYRYQVKKGKPLFREAADPTMLLFKGTYYLFASMTGGFWHSDDLCNWRFRATPELPVYDYAPDVREVNGAVLFSASKHFEKCALYRSMDPLNQPFEPVSAPFPFWDPDLFWDDDGRLYLYWGCSNMTPIWGVELDAGSLQPIGEKIALFGGNEAEHGWERAGEDNRFEMPEAFGERLFKSLIGAAPFIEGAYMTKHGGRYYLQYAAPGTEYNVYADGVYAAERPLGPYAYQAHNPFSSKPGGFVTGAGHGSTFQDKFGNWWHISTMRVSVHDKFERRVGLFPCGFDADGALYCNQNFADYPQPLPEGKRGNMDDIEPQWMLLSCKKAASASSSEDGHGPEHGCDENIRTWWAAKDASEAEWYMLDLGEAKDVRAVQVNFADHFTQPLKGDLKRMQSDGLGRRLIRPADKNTGYLLEGSADGENWLVLKDARQSSADCPHDFIALDGAMRLRCVRVSHMEMPFGGVPALSGLRVFGKGNGQKPAVVRSVRARREGELNILLSWDAAKDAMGYNVRYGIAPDKLYSSWQLYEAAELDLSTVNKGAPYYVAVDSYNENGVTPGEIVQIP